MRYITNYDDHVVTVSFGGNVECEHGACTEYEGSVPTGYTSLEAWYAEESEKLHRWKVVDGQLTRNDEAAEPPQCRSWVDRIYPVGSIYMSVSPADPGGLFGGTWARIEDCFLLAAGQTYEAGTTGGEAEHTLTVEELPEHDHKISLTSGAVASGTDYSRVSSTGSAASGLISGSDSLKGLAHNNMPPYLAVYMWQRVADPVPEEPDIPDLVTGDVADKNPV